MKKIRVQGSHYECGLQIGYLCHSEINSIVKESMENPPKPYTWQEMRDRSIVFLQATEYHFPWILDEIRGAAEGAGQDYIDLCASSIEELYSTPIPSRCSDFVALPPATSGGILLGHNNDLEPSAKKTLVAVEWVFSNSPVLYSIGPGGLYISVGLNSEGICLTGNDLSQNDEHPGIPRGFIARAIMGERVYENALRIALHPERASSYNNIITCRDGQCVSVEASGTDCELIYPQNGWLVHTNHYTHVRMRQYEFSPDQIGGSIARYERALALTHLFSSSVNLKIIQGFLSDHQSIQSLCRHGDQVQTVFSSLIDLSDGKIWGCLGNPCAQNYELLWDINNQ
jgi:hypothetical protein